VPSLINPLYLFTHSLLFGIPFTLQAGLDVDFDRYRETQTIVASLLRLLEDREEALLLSMKEQQCPARSSSTASKTASYNDRPGLFVSNVNGQARFVLMSKQACSGAPPSTAILFRVANDTDVLADAGNGGANGAMSSLSSSILLDEETALQYTAFLESSLSSLPCSAFNPMATIPAATSDAVAPPHHALPIAAHHHVETDASTILLAGEGDQS
jgi:hypothetical protein